MLHIRDISLVLYRLTFLSPLQTPRIAEAQERRENPASPIQTVIREGSLGLKVDVIDGKVGTSNIGVFGQGRQVLTQHLMIYLKHHNWSKPSLLWLDNCYKYTLHLYKQFCLCSVLGRLISFFKLSLMFCCLTAVPDIDEGKLFLRCFVLNKRLRHIPLAYNLCFFIVLCSILYSLCCSVRVTGRGDQCGRCYGATPSFCARRDATLPTWVPPNLKLCLLLYPPWWRTFLAWS